MYLGPAKSIRVPVLDWKIPLSFGTGKKVRVPMRERVQPKHFIPGALNLFCFGVCIAGLATLATTWTDASAASDDGQTVVSPQVSEQADPEADYVLRHIDDDGDIIGVQDVNNNVKGSRHVVC